MTDLGFQVGAFMRPLRGVLTGTQLKLKSFSVLGPQARVPDNIAVGDVHRPGETGYQRDAVCLYRRHREYQTFLIRQRRRPQLVFTKRDATEIYQGRRVICRRCGCSSGVFCRPSPCFTLRALLQEVAYVKDVKLTAGTTHTAPGISQFTSQLHVAGKLAVAR